MCHLYPPTRGKIAETLTNQSTETATVALTRGNVTLIARTEIILLHILQDSDQRDSEPTWENICVTPFKYFLYRRKIFPMILKLFQYPQAENISIMIVCIYLCSVDDPAVECFVTGSGRGLPALDYNLIKADCWREECYL